MLLLSFYLHVNRIVNPSSGALTTGHDEPIVRRGDHRPCDLRPDNAGTLRAGSLPTAGADRSKGPIVELNIYMHDLVRSNMFAVYFCKISYMVHSIHLNLYVYV